MTDWHTEPIPIPVQPHAIEGLVSARGAQMHFRDTGGDGTPVILLHPATGSDRIWGYQQSEFAAGGYRVIAWSRRGHAGSDPVSDADPGTAAGDLHAVVQHFGLNRFHLVGCAAGGGIALDYALSHPRQLLSVVVACAIGSITEPDYAERASRLRPPGFDDMPASFRELSPSYRAANPEGVAEWERLERQSVTGRRHGQAMENRINWTSLSRLPMPVLVIGGDADLYAPPALLRAYSAHIPGATLVIIPEAGHSLYWEAPHVFNAQLLNFWAQIGR